MPGKSPVASSGSAIGFPSLIACLTFLMPSSITRFPEDLDVISRPSIIGTPEDIIVESVLENFATATFLRRGPNNGSFRNTLSIWYLIFGTFMEYLKAANTATMIIIMTHQYPLKKLLMLITICVGAGRVPPKETNISLNVGITNIISMATTTTATQMTIIGYTIALYTFPLIASDFSMCSASLLRMISRTPPSSPAATRLMKRSSIT